MTIAYEAPNCSTPTNPSPRITNHTDEHELNKTINAYRILNDSTGLKRVQLKKFRCFGSPPVPRPVGRDVAGGDFKVKIGRLITVAYLALCKNSRKTCPADKSESIRWCPIDELPRLPFDHKEIIEAAIQEIRNWVEKEPAIIFDYMPMKFTAFQLRRTYEVIYNREMDVRNFHKKMNSLEYVVPRRISPHVYSPRCLPTTTDNKVNPKTQPTNDL